MTTRLEHANITVPDIDAAIGFLRAIDPAFTVLHDSGPGTERRWVHLGVGEDYIALSSPSGHSNQRRQRHADIGINHVGLVVDDADAAAARLIAARFRESYTEERHPARVRRYFEDSAGIEWELVTYLTDDPSRRFSYAQA